APTPGTSKGALNVTFVFLFQSSAEAFGAMARQAVNTHTMVSNLVKIFIFYLFFENFGSRPRGVRGGNAGPGAPAALNLFSGWLMHAHGMRCVAAINMRQSNQQSWSQLTRQSCLFDGELRAGEHLCTDLALSTR